LRYLAGDVYRLLDEAGCVFEGDRTPCGQGWYSPDFQVFFLPDPDQVADGTHWFIAEVVEDIFKDRWLKLDFSKIRKYPDA
jgi:hypothetical protein